MVHRPFVAPPAEPKKVPEKLQQIETELAQCKSGQELIDRRYQEQAQLIVSQTEDITRLKACVKDLMAKLGAEVPDFLIESGPAPASMVTAPKNTESIES